MHSGNPENNSPRSCQLGFKKQRLSGERKKYRVVGDISQRPLDKGRPIEVQVQMVYQLARQMLPIAEIAGVLGMRRDQLDGLIQGSSRLSDAIEQGYAETRQHLRKTQLDLALSGHSSMLMWLGKQYLGQADQHKVESKTEINITVQRAMDELRNIPKNKLMQAMALIDTPVIDND